MHQIDYLVKTRSNWIKLDQIGSNWIKLDQNDMVFTIMTSSQIWSKHGLKHGLNKHGLDKHGLDKHGLDKHGLDMV